MTLIPPYAVFLIFLMPLISFAISAFIIRPFFNHKSQYAGYITIGCIGVSLALALWTLISVHHNVGEHHGVIDSGYTEWLTIGDTTITLGLMINQLTAIMVVVVSFCSLMVQIYSQGYMHGDSGYTRYYAAMSLFTASMLGLVMSDNLIQLFVFWELVGLCSYLLIGFWFHKPSAARAAKKAFLVTRLGDFGLLAGVLLLYFNTDPIALQAVGVDAHLAEEAHSLNIHALYEVAPTLATLTVAGASVMTLATIGIFAGAVGKSAQFPLHTWLPDAMEGPTPVSALIHSSTMVTAGVFLVARCFPMFVHSDVALITVAAIGGFTAIFAASMALVANDIKRVLAYCTVSQLGYMMLQLGAAGLFLIETDDIGQHAAELAVAFGIFHLFNHAFCKALLFLASGSVNHATGTFDMREMGGLRKHMKWTYLCYFVGTVSMAGIWPLACFWSKDEIVAGASELNSPHNILFYLAMITVFMTAFYMFRSLFMTFHGEYRGHNAGGHGDHGSHGGLHESPKVMLIPMFLLTGLAIGSGWININGWWDRFFGGHHSYTWTHLFTTFKGHKDDWLPLIALVIAVAGVALAYVMYIRRESLRESFGKTLAIPYKVFLRKYWMDELYENFFVVRVLVDGFFKIVQLVDTYIVDGLVNGIAGGILTDGRILRVAQNGQLQRYGLILLAGLLVVVGFVFLYAR